MCIRLIRRVSFSGSHLPRVSVSYWRATSPIPTATAGRTGRSTRGYSRTAARVCRRAAVFARRIWRSSAKARAIATATLLAVALLLAERDPATALLLASPGPLLMPRGAGEWRPSDDSRCGESQSGANTRATGSPGPWTAPRTSHWTDTPPQNAHTPQKHPKPAHRRPNTQNPHTTTHTTPRRL